MLKKALILPPAACKILQIEPSNRNTATKLAIMKQNVSKNDYNPPTASHRDYKRMILPIETHLMLCALQTHDFNVVNKFTKVTTPLSALFRDFSILRRHAAQSSIQYVDKKALDPISRTLCKSVYINGLSGTGISNICHSDRSRMKNLRILLKQHFEPFLGNSDRMGCSFVMKPKLQKRSRKPTNKRIQNKRIKKKRMKKTLRRKTMKRKFRGKKISRNR